MRVTIVQGHPDPTGFHYGDALADPYAQATLAAGHRRWKLRELGKSAS